MRAVVQRVSEASVKVAGEVVGKIGHGLLVLCGFSREETPDDLSWMARKIAALRVFDDQDGVMNLSLLQTGGDILAVSQFTLMASTRRGNRPSYIEAASPDISEPLYEEFLSELEKALGKGVERGRFGACMEVSLVNDGPATYYLDSKKPL